MSDDTSPAAAEYARLQADAAQARTHLDALAADPPGRDDAADALFNAEFAAEAYLREHPAAVPVYGAAMAWQAMGVSTIPVKRDGSKSPLVKWKQYQGVLPPEDELWRWHHRGNSGLAALTGLRASDDGLLLEMFEFEGRAASEGIFDAFLDAIKEAGLTEVWQRIVAGYWDISPSGGPRFWYLCEDVCGNTKLASRPSTPEELAANPDDPVKTLIESRGLGGYAVVAPTSGRYHNSGKAWVAMGGPPASCAIVTPSERESVWAVARTFNTAPTIAARTRKVRARYERLGGPARAAKAEDGAEGGSETETEPKPSTRPGDIFNERATWAELLEPDGWTLFQRDADGTEFWCRPGKDRGTSATTSNPQHEGDKLHVFTSSTQLEMGETYSKFAYYATTKHEGDFAAAAAQLRKEGYTVTNEAAAGGDVEEEVTDSHLVKLFAGEVLRDMYCWVRGWGWMTYRDARHGGERRGLRWFPAEDGEVELLARNWLLSRYEAFREDNPKASASEVKDWRRQLAQNHVVAVSVAARSEVRRQMIGFDRHPDLLCCANCIADLRTGAMLDHAPEYLITKSTGVDYVPGTTHPDWTQALTALPDGVRDWFQVRIGQATTGYVPPDEALMVQIGTGSNGKTTVVQGLRHGLGDYYVQVPVKALMGGHREHDTVLMTFKGARLAAVEETPEESRLNMQQVKAISTQQITARYCGKDYITYDTTHTTVANTNHAPVVESADYGSLRRLLMLVYPYRHLDPGKPLVLPTDRTGDPGLRDRIRDGAQGQHEAVLAWMIAGAVRWYEAGRVMPRVPEQVAEDTREWLNRVNLIFAFGTEYLKQDDPRRIISDELFQFFLTFLAEGKHRPWSKPTFNARLAEFAAARGWHIVKKKTKHDEKLLSHPDDWFPVDVPPSYQAWHGIRFKSEEDEPDAASESPEPAAESPKS